MSHLVAHRGQKFTFPENTLESIQAAIACGATAVEFDVQMTADHIPVVCHDISLLNTAGIDVTISDMNYTQLKKISIGEPARFEDKYSSIKLPSLQEMVAALIATPHVKVFVELKDESIAVFGRSFFLQQVLEQIQPIQDQCVVIADDLQALTLLQQQVSIPVGWIIHRWDEENLSLARQSNVNYLIVNHQYCPQQDYNYSADSWDWVMYQTCDPDKARVLFEQGVRFVESDNVCFMLKQLPEYK